MQNKIIYNFYLLQTKYIHVKYEKFLGEKNDEVQLSINI